MTDFSTRIRSPQTWITIGLIVLLAGSVAFVGWAIYDSRQSAEAAPVATVVEEEPAPREPPPPPPPPTYFCPLDGTEYADRDVTLKRAVVVQVDNAPAARPQTGLSLADIVYEGMAEGQITRFSAVYLCRNAAVVGPVRSARLINLELVPEYQALLANSGASIGVNNAIAADPNVPNISQGAYPSAFWRVADRYAPHDMMTSTSLVRQVAADVGIPVQVELSGPPFKADSPAPGKLTYISIPYSPWAGVSYSYNPADNTWLRFMQGEPHIDAGTGTQLAAKNVVVQYVPSYESDIKEDENNYGLIFELTGTGPVLIFRDGEVISGSWSRPTLGAITTYVDDYGSPIQLNQGPTWIQLVPTDFPSVEWG